jgi:hypothetical protein
MQTVGRMQSYLYIYKTLRYVSVQDSAVSGLQERNRTYNTKSVEQNVIRYQVLLAAYYKADTKYQVNCDYKGIQRSLGLRCHRLTIRLPWGPIFSISDKFWINDMFMISHGPPISANRSAPRWT